MQTEILSISKDESSEYLDSIYVEELENMKNEHNYKKC